MPKAVAAQRARKDAKAGKSPSTQASEFVREEMHELKHGKGNAKSRRQAVAIGLSEARRSGVPIPDKSKGNRPNKRGGKSRSRRGKAA